MNNSETTLVMSGGRVLPCTNLNVIEDGAVSVIGDRIAWVGAIEALPERFQDAPRIDTTGSTVLPGLVDAHMHISFGEAASEEELSLHTPLPYRAIRAGADASKVLEAGVTTACDPGGPAGIAAAVRDAIEVGMIDGPRFSAASRQITTQQGIGDTLPAPLGDLPTSFGAIVRGPNDIVQVIRDEVKRGADLIKIAGSGPGTEEYGAFAVDELRVAVTEAHRLERPITIHARSRQSIADAVATGFDWIMHASFMDTRTLDEVVARDIPLVPAMTLLVNTLEAGADALPVKTLDAMRRELDAAVSILAKARLAGATLIAGSETGFAMTPYGEWHTRELELFVDYLGFSDHEAILSMTRNAARATPRHGADVGTLEVGKYADLLVIDGRPDHNVRLLGQPNARRMVMKGGVEVQPTHRASRRQLPHERTRLFTPAIHHRPENQA